MAQNRSPRQPRRELSNRLCYDNTVSEAPAVRPEWSYGMGTTVYLQRHGEAESPLGKPDSDRALTEEGVAAVKAATDGLLSMGVRLDKCLSSPLERARQTAELVWGQLGGESPFEVVDALKPGASPDAVLEEIRLSDGRSVLVVGHMPDLCLIAAYLASKSSTRVCSFLPGAIARIDFDGEVAAGHGMVEWAKRPEELAPH